jgi:hypothetical protein
MTSRHRPSKIAHIVAAVRRTRRRHSTKALGAPTMRESLELAVRDHHPRTVKGLAAQGATLAAISGARNGGRLVPVLGLAAALPAELLIPGPTAAALAVAGAAGAIAHHRAAQPGVLVGWRGRQLGVAAGATGALAFTGATATGLLDGMAFWQQAVVLGCTWAPGAIAWWKPRPDAPAIDPGPTGPRLPAEMEVLRTVLTEATSRERSPIAGGRIVSLDHPAQRVASAVVHVPGIHVNGLPLETLRRGLEAFADVAGRAHPGLGTLQPGAVEITPSGVSELAVTVTWSRELAEQKLPYTPPDGLAEGMAWLGRTEDRQDIAVPCWERHAADGKVSVRHVKILGMTGAGKSFTLRTLLYGGLKTATELVIPLDAKGDSLDEIAALVPGGKIARDADSWQAGIELFAAIFLSRKQRQGTPDAWTGPKPGDPIVTLIIDEAAAARLGLTNLHHGIVELAARQGRSLGVRTIQASQVPLVDEWVGGGPWRAQASITLLHNFMDPTHARIAAGGIQPPQDLIQLPPHFCTVALNGTVTAARTRVANLAPEDVAAITTAATLHPIDQQLAGAAWDAYIQAVTVGRPGMGDNESVTAALIELGTPGFGDAITTTVTTTAAPASPVPAQTRGQNVIDIRQAPRAQSSDASIRDLIVTRLLTTSVLPTRPQLVAELTAPPYNKSRSGVQKQIAVMLETGALIEEAGRIAPAILA